MQEKSFLYGTTSVFFAETRIANSSSDYQLSSTLITNIGCFLFFFFFFFFFFF